MCSGARNSALLSRNSLSDKKFHIAEFEIVQEFETFPRLLQSLSSPFLLQLMFKWLFRA